MKVLHICNDFLWTKVHKELYMKLDSKNITQYIFVPLRDNNHKNQNSFNFNELSSRVLYSDVLKRHHSFIFESKIKTLYSSLTSNKDLKLDEIDIVHATTLFSDGAIAYNLYKNYKIPYIVAVRNTDINIFLKNRPDLFLLAYKIIKNSKKVIFISEANKEAFTSKLLFKLNKKFLETKSIVIPNGINNYWHKNILKSTKYYDSKSILYIGRFDENKNVESLIKALIRLKSAGDVNIQLTLVGGGGSEEKVILNYVDKYSWIKFLGRVDDHKELNEIYACHNYFAMISHKETFGLVYIEALTQGLSLLYTKGQGVDGTFIEKIGYSTSSLDQIEISNQITKLFSIQDSSQILDIDFSEFDWNCIVSKYLVIYQNIINEKNLFRN